MGNTDSRVGRVDTLTTVATGTVNINTKILWVNLEILLFGLWENGNRGGTSMNTALALCYRDALDAMNATFKLEFAIWLIAGNAENDLFVATGIVNGFGLQFNFETMSFGVADIHAIEVARKKARLITAGTGANFNNGRLVVVRIARNEHFGEFRLCFGEFFLKIRLHFGKIWVIFSLSDVRNELIALFAERNELIKLLKTTVFGSKIRVSIGVWLAEEVRNLLALGYKSIKI